MSKIPKVFTNYMVLHVKDPKSLEGSEIPDDALITNSNSLEMLFGLQTSPPDKPQWSWGQIKNNIPDLEKSMWVKELGKVMKQASKGIGFPATQSVFQSPNNRKIYLPSLHSLDIEADGSRNFYILFIEQTKWAVVRAADDRFSTLLSCLILGNRFQWELCIHHLYKLDNQDIPINEIATMLKEVLMNIEEEATIRQRVEFHQNANERLVWAFDINDTRRGEVEKNLANQSKYKQKLKNITEEQDINEIKQILHKLLDLNNRLMSIICQRYQELIDKVYTKEEWVRAVLGELGKRQLFE